MSRSFESTAPRRFTLAALSCVFALACGGHENVSVGDLDCSSADANNCTRFEPQALDSQVPPPMLPVTEVSAEVVWKRPVVVPPACTSPECKLRVESILVQADGETVLAGLLMDPDPVQLWVSWYDAQGELLFQAEVPDSEPALALRILTDLQLVRAPDGSTMLLNSYLVDDGKGSFDRMVDGHAIARTGEMTLAFRFEIDHIHVSAQTLRDSGLLTAGSKVGVAAEVASYSPAGEMRWRQARVGAVPGPHDTGVSFDYDSMPDLHALAVDSRGDVWGVLHEGLVGFVQLRSDGDLAWHGWAPIEPKAQPYFTSAPRSLLAIDSSDRPIATAQGAVLRLAPDTSAPEDDGARYSLQMVTADQQEYYPPHADSLALDAQDRIYVGTQDGPRSARRVVIDRVAEDFGAIVRFLLPPEEDVHTGRIDHLHIAEDGDAYVHFHGGPYNLADALSGQSIEEYDYIARLRLPAP